MGKLDQQLSRAHVHRHDAPVLGGGRDRAGHCNGENRQANQSGHSAAGFQQDRLRLRMPPGGARPCAPAAPMKRGLTVTRSEEHTSELQSLMRISYAVLCLEKKKSQHNVYNLTYKRK